MASSTEQSVAIASRYVWPLSGTFAGSFSGSAQAEKMSAKKANGRTREGIGDSTRSGARAWMRPVGPVRPAGSGRRLGASLWSHHGWARDTEKAFRRRARPRRARGVSEEAARRTRHAEDAPARDERRRAGE